MLLLIFQVFLAVTIAKSGFEESLEPNETNIQKLLCISSVERVDLYIVADHQFLLKTSKSVYKYIFIF